MGTWSSETASSPVLDPSLDTDMLARSKERDSSASSSLLSLSLMSMMIGFVS